mmetsp:Transcript_37924/g.59987  ORF Transcript_37924/g.59987 Transcript_37924/m.59987 type:complete len:93 (-) Transcript_37924:19-297(-)
MQCPGGPMENYRVLGRLPNPNNGKPQWFCVNSSQQSYYDFARVLREENSLSWNQPWDTTGYLLCKKGGLDVKLFDIPDPDDWAAYGSAFQEV